MERGHGANGNGAELPSIPNEEAPPAATALATKQLSDMIDAQVQQVVGVTFRGLLVSAPGVPHNVLLPCIARAAGKMLAMSVAGNSVELTVRARKDFQDAFRDGLAKVPILQPANLMPLQAG